MNGPSSATVLCIGGRHWGIPLTCPFKRPRGEGCGHDRLQHLAPSAFEQWSRSHCCPASDWAKWCYKVLQRLSLGQPLLWPPPLDCLGFHQVCVLCLCHGQKLPLAQSYFLLSPFQVVCSPINHLHSWLILVSAFYRGQQEGYATLSLLQTHLGDDILCKRIPFCPRTFILFYFLGTWLS